MAINLITGLPGHGKGVYSLDTVEKLRIKSNRPVYYHNIKDLNLQWHALDDPKKWIDCPEGSIIVLDEAWQTFPLRPNAQTPPEYVSRLATHRHHGFDIYIITQQPTQLDSFVRKLVDTHYHIVRKFGSQAAN
ncbi:MAG TPA: zonular occludens toxin domain-containing protein, partial [Methylophilus sp.]